MEGTTNFSSMSDELKLNIFLRLFDSPEKINKKEIVNYSPVCRDWHKLFEDKIFWKTKSEHQSLTLSKNPRERYLKTTQIYTNLINGSFVKTDQNNNFLNLFYTQDGSDSSLDSLQKISDVCKDSKFFKISGENVITTHRQGDVFIWNVIKDTVQIIKVGENIDHLDVKGNTLVTVSEKIVQIWDLKTLQIKRCFPPALNPSQESPSHKNDYITEKQPNVTCVHIHDKDNIFIGYDSEVIFHLERLNHNQKISNHRIKRDKIKLIHTLVINNVLHVFSQTEEMQVRHRLLTNKTGQVTPGTSNPEFTHTVVVADIIFRAYKNGTIKIIGGPNKLDESIHTLKKGETVESLQFVEGKLYIRTSNKALVLLDFSEKLKSIKDIEFASTDTDMLIDNLYNNSPFPGKV